MQFAVEVRRAEAWEVLLVGPDGTVYKSRAAGDVALSRAAECIVEELSPAAREQLLTELLRACSEELRGRVIDHFEKLSSLVKRHLDDPDWPDELPTEERLRKAAAALEANRIDSCDYEILCEALGLPTNVTVDVALEELQGREVPTLLRRAELDPQLKELAPDVRAALNMPVQDEQLVALINRNRKEAAMQARAARAADKPRITVHCLTCRKRYEPPPGDSGQCGDCASKGVSPVGGGA